MNEVGVETRRGFVPVPPMLRVATALLLEAYPRVVRYSSLIMAFEELPLYRDSEDPMNSFRARLTGFRKPLLEIGLSYSMTWGYGYSLEIDL